MVARLLRSMVGRVRAPEYRVPDETFWQSQLRRSFRRDWKGRRDSKLRP